MLQALRAAVHRWSAPAVAPPEGPDAIEKRAATILAVIEKRFGNPNALQGLMNAGKPGNWGGDHAAEAQHLTGWNFVAITQLANQVMQADIEAYRDVGQFTLAQLSELWDRRKGRLRKVGKTRLFKAYGDDNLEAEQLPPTHPLCEMLRKPNPDQTGGLFNYERVLQLRLTGCVFIWNVPNKFGRTVRRYVLPTSAMQAVEPTADLPNGGWRIDPSAGCDADEDGFRPSTFRRMYFNGYVIPAEEIQTIGYPHPTRKDDYQSPLSAGALWVDTADQVDEARYAQLKNGCDPSAVMSPPEDTDASEDEIQAVYKAIEAKYCGPARNRKLMMVAPGTDVKVLSHTAKDMDYSTGWQQSRDAVLALHHTPALVVGAEVPGTYGAMGVAVRFYNWATVRSVLCLLADADTEFFAPQFGKGLSVWYEAQAFDDPELLEKQLANDLAGGVRTLNEWRSIRGLEPDDTPAGDEYVKSGGAATLPPEAEGTLPGQPKPTVAKPKDDEENPAPFNLPRPRFSIPGTNGNGKAASNGHANGHDHFADARKKAPREYLPEGAPIPATFDDAIALIKAVDWSDY